MSTSCPHGARKTGRAGERLSPAVELIDGVWHVRSYPLVKEVLRAGTTVQAGFNVDMVRGGARAMREPILYLDGPEHRRQRSMIARYFAPATVSRRYRELMESRAAELVDEVRTETRAGRTVDLGRISLEYSVAVAAAVIGLTDSRGMARRLERLFAIPAQPPRSHVGGEDDAGGDSSRGVGAAVASLAGRFSAVVSATRGLGPVAHFYARDVRPAIKARRERRREDVISHLLDQGYTDSEITTECVTYAAAGMVTTREYICIVAWHLLEDDDLRRRYVAGDEAERHELLHEILRLEPVVGHLFRRAVEDLTLTDGDVVHHVPAGAVLDLSIRAANADEGSVGADPLALCPGRDIPKGVRPEAMSFGDGNHRCPGNALAIQETDVLLTRLLSLPLGLHGEPRLGWLDLIVGYEVHDLRLAHNGGAEEQSASVNH
ncbi:cytochrome P450 [Mobilicoccus massiliensis]|uniref:cytochrome P450 n=1 Tax=Mobilicoccus massiliensis TaxID=1522310 RepID=UPI00058FA5A7|nr:cytochrome P450 [Mobilicoccus massiliensis]